MTMNHTLHASAATALVQLLPSQVPLSPAVSSKQVPADVAAAAVIGAFVGTISADLALTLIDTSNLQAAGGAGAALVSPENVLRPALESAAATLGAGVLGECRIQDGASLFADEETVVFELTGAAGLAGWFGIRIRENGVVNDNAAASKLAGGGVKGAGGVASKLSRINNVEMSLTVEIGRTRMSVRDVLNLEPGGVVELDRSAGAPADILLNGRVIAHGEVVVVDQDYAVRITKILDVADGLN